MIRSSCPLVLKRSSATTRTPTCVSTTRVTLHWKPTIKKLLAPFAISWVASSRPRPPLHRSARLCVTKGNVQKTYKKGNIMTNGKKDVTVVLVHGAWADGSSWNRVTEQLQRNGFNVVAAQIPLTSEQSLRRENSDSLAACSRMGRTSRSFGISPSSELAEHVSLSGRHLGLDVRCGYLFHLGAGAHNQAPRKNPQPLRW